MEKPKNNFLKYCIQITAYTVALMFLNGAIVQAFLLFVGLSEDAVYAYSSLSQLAQVIAMILMIFLSGKIKNGRRLSAISNIIMLLPLSLMIIGAISPSLFTDAFIILLLVFCFVTFSGIGVYAVLTYCLPFDLIDIADYGKLTGVSGAAAGVSTFALASLHTLIISNFDYLVAMIWFFVLAAASAILSAVMFFSMKELPRGQNKNSAIGWSDIIEVFKNRDTYYLLVPNFARGLAMGIFNVMAVMAVSSGIADTSEVSALTIVTQAASFVANIVFSIFYKKVSLENMLIISTVGVCISLPFCMSFGFVAFLIFNLISLFFRFIIDSAIPTALVNIIPESQIGAYSSIRMLIFTASQAVAAIIITPLVSLVGNIGVLIFAAVMQLVCGIGHYLVVILHKKQTKAYFIS